ncbi:nuclear distribution protein nudE [Nannizzia gypsea CBS 118893]|uniref:Nuclear distribution protein nudE n=1 Tax=Arthroderma gypseum (strain ATCC MYA-4604 / CBS 118893) TaxID=535722 RepID=E4UQ07_ARTGP|nr:nuclear distribution protein nudE [Nannizzia gypsea CBS 118893]EFQ99141.1 nuclear distribution protein nudE [Nannizzia gypsea CBS 118893]
MAMADPPSSPPNAKTSTADAIAYYKSQYELLEAELTDFQSSSRELEAELEKDIEASEKRERKLKEKVESLGYEVEEWKTKYKQAKTDANSVQSTLQKEITTLRDSNRTLQLKLRDTEVANDDFERQARNTTSSLEDIESKYNISIERGVLLEEEIKNGEQEREMLRIKEQRLRDELADLKVETHIVQEKLRKAEAALERKAKFSLLESTSTNGIIHRLDADHSPATTTSSPIATPLTKSASSIASEIATPPSPPFSESSTNGAFRGATPNMPRPRVSISETNGLSKHQKSASRSSRHSRVPSISTGRMTPSAGRQSTSNGLPKSSSLYQIRGLIGKMQKLEERVQSARSRLPAPVDTPPRASPRTGSAMGGPLYNMPSSVTVRSNRKRSSGSVASSSRDNHETPHTPVTPGTHLPQGRNSFGLPPPAQSTPSRPESRTSMSSSRCSVSNMTSSSSIAHPRPESRQSLNSSLSGSRTPGHYTTNSLNMSMASVSDNHHYQHHSHNHNNNNSHHQHHPSVSSTGSSGGIRRPRSSLSNYNPSASMSYIDEDNAEMDLSMHTPTPRRYDSIGSGSSIPTPSVLRRTSGGMSSIPTPSGLTPRRTTSALGRRDGDMLPPSAGRRKASMTPRPSSSLGSLGETY